MSKEETPYGTFNEPAREEVHMPLHERKEDKNKFTKSVGLTSLEAEQLLAQYGRNELPEKVVPLWYVFLQLLWQPMPLMIWLAAIVEVAIGNYLDMGILLIIQFANASIAFYETTKAGDAVAALKASLKPEATVKRDRKWITIDAREVVPGDLVLLASGSAIPADCRVNHGTIAVDQSQLTGESMPVTMHENSACMMGSTVVRGEVEGTVEYTGANTFFGKTASLLQV
jgi:H+-transporting ATPase